MYFIYLHFIYKIYVTNYIYDYAYICLHITYTYIFLDLGYIIKLYDSLCVLVHR